MNVFCYYCGCLTTTARHGGKKGGSLPDNFRTTDHMLPKSKGGRGWSSNTVFCCDKCNRDKGCLTFDEYRAVMAHRKGLLTIPAARVFAGERFPKAIFARTPNKAQKVEIVLDNLVVVVVLYFIGTVIPAIVRHT